MSHTEKQDVTYYSGHEIEVNGKRYVTKRTCHMDIHAEERNGRYVWVYTFSCGHEFESYWYMNPRYCQFCGDEVVS